MKYWFDTEFQEDGKTIELISLGIVAEDGREYYRENAEYDPKHATAWLKDNVIPHLTGEAATREVIGREIIQFVGERPEFWAYYADYDWVVFCQLYGPMMALPKGWPMYCRDLKQWCDSLGNPRLPRQHSTEHHALEDARWVKKAWVWLQEYETKL